MQASDAIQPTDGDDFGHRIRSNILEISIRIRSEDFFFDPPTSVALSPSNQDFNSPTSVALGNLSQDFQLTDVGDFGSPRIKDFNSPTSVALGNLSQNFNSPTSVTLGGLGVRISTYRRR